MKDFTRKLEGYKNELTATDFEFTELQFGAKKKTLLKYKVTTKYAEFIDTMTLSKRSDLDQKPSLINTKIDELLSNLNVLNRFRVKFVGQLRIKDNKATVKVRLSLGLDNVKEGGKPHQVKFKNGEVLTRTFGFFERILTVNLLEKTIIEELKSLLNSFDVVPGDVADKKKFEVQKNKAFKADLSRVQKRVIYTEEKFKIDPALHTIYKPSQRTEASFTDGDGDLITVYYEPEFRPVTQADIEAMRIMQEFKQMQIAQARPKAARYAA